MGVSIVEDSDPAFTRQTTSLFSADSSVPRSVMVSCRCSNCVLCRTRSVRAVVPKTLSIPVAEPTRMKSPTTATTETAAVSRRTTLRGPLLFGRVEGFGGGEPFGGLSPRPVFGSGEVGWPFVSVWAVAVGAGGRAVAGCDVIDPHSSGIYLHQAHVTVDTDAAGEVGNPSIVKVVLCPEKRILRREKLVRQRRGVPAATAAGPPGHGGTDRPGGRLRARGLLRLAERL